MNWGGLLLKQEQQVELGGTYVFFIIIDTTIM